MSENTAPAACTDLEWKAASASGLLFATPGTTAQERAIHGFAEAIRASERAVAAELLTALQLAEGQISDDRDTLFESCVNQATNELDDADDRELIAQYDAKLTTIRAAIARATGAAS